MMDLILVFKLVYEYQKRKKNQSSGMGGHV